MKKTRSKSCYHSNSILIKDGEKFRICLPFPEYENSPELKKFGLPEKFIDGYSFLPKPISGKAKENVFGKFVRAQPEEKTQVERHISFTKKNGTKVSYDRYFNVWKKELQIRPNFTFEFWENESGEKYVCSKELIFSPEYQINLENTFYLNLFLQIFGSFEVLDESGNFPLPLDKRFDFEILPPGTKLEDDLSKIEEFTENIFGKGSEIQRSFMERIEFIRKFKPEVAAHGTDGFAGYIVFEFQDKDFVLVESIKSGNATYIFPKENYKDLIKLDKQTIISKGLMKKRIAHDSDKDHEKWKKKIWAILK